MAVIQERSDIFSVILFASWQVSSLYKVEHLRLSGRANTLSLSFNQSSLFFPSAALYAHRQTHCSIMDVRWQSNASLIIGQLAATEQSDRPPLIWPLRFSISSMNEHAASYWRERERSKLLLLLLLLSGEQHQQQQSNVYYFCFSTQ